MNLSADVSGKDEVKLALRPVPMYLARKRRSSLGVAGSGSSPQCLRHLNTAKRAGILDASTTWRYPMLDVHVLVSSETPFAWAGACHRSLRNALLRSPYPVRIHWSPAYPDHIGKARMVGFAQGTHPYVTFVDEDDWVDDDFFASFAPLLEGDPTAIFLPEWMELPDGKSVKRQARHCRGVYRRECVEAFDFVEWPVYAEVALRLDVEAKSSHVVDAPDAHYHWRYQLHSGAKKLAEKFPHLTARIRDSLHVQPA